MCENTAMAQLSQIQISFAPIEDRLLLRISTDEQAEFRFWLTRRYVKLLWPLLEQLLASDTAVAVQTSDLARTAVMDFQQADALANADFDTAYNDTANTLPLGEAAVILVHVQGKRGADGIPILCMHPRHGVGIEIALEPNILHSLRALLRQALETADWALVPPAPMPHQAMTPPVLN
jgi:hypothetical protein